MSAKKLSTTIIILLASTAYFLFVAMDTLSKYMTQHMEVNQLIWGRYFFHLIAMLIYFAIFKPKLDLKKNFKIQIIRSSLLIFATFLIILCHIYKKLLYTLCTVLMIFRYTCVIGLLHFCYTFAISLVYILFSTKNSLVKI